jgi:hypothetical protein
VVSRINLILIVSVLAVVCPNTGFAQESEQRPGLRLPTTLFATAATADWATTYHGIKHYRLRETNPLLRRFEQTPAKMVLIGAAIDAGAVVAWNHYVGRKHPRMAAAGLWTMTAFRAYLAIHNMRNAQRAPRR